MVFNRHDQFIGKALKVYGEYSEGEYDVLAGSKPAIQLSKPAQSGRAYTGTGAAGRPNGRSMPLSPSG